MRFLLLWLCFMGTGRAQETLSIDSDDAALSESLSDLGIEPAGPPLEGEAITVRADEVGHKLRCPQCQGLSVAASKADSAQTIYQRIHELVAQGYSEEQILDYFVSRYGEGILLEPKVEGMNWVIWAGPGLAVLLGVVVVGVMVSKRRRTQDLVPAAESEDLHEGDLEEVGLRLLDAARTEAKDPYLRAVLAEVEARSRAT